MKGSAHTELEHGEHVHAIATYDVTTAAPGPRLVYRASFELGFEPPSPESSVVVDPSAARFAGTFASLDVPVPDSRLSNNDQGGGVVVVTLDGPREVREVAFAAAESFSHTTVNLLRIDKDVPAPKATVHAGVGTGNAAFLSGFTDVRFAIGVDGRELKKTAVAAVTVRGKPTGPRVGLADPAHSNDVTFFWPGPDDTGTDVEAGPAFAKALEAYLAEKPGDPSPSARLVLQSDQPCRFLLTAFATGASFAVDGFAFPELRASDLTDADALAARIRTAADPVSAHLRSAIGPAELLDGLNAVLAGDALYDPERFAEVTLSPATQAILTAGGDLTRLNRLLLQDAYPDLVASPAAKRVLRFAPGGVSEARVAVRLPAGATVSKATLSTQESLRSDRPADAQVAGPVGGERVGVHVDGSGTAAASVVVDEATAATGVALPLLAVASTTEVAVELQEDWQGAPSGKRLAAGTAALEAPGEAGWATVFFDRVVIPSGPVWIVLRAAKGEAVWLAAPADGGGLRVVRAPDRAPASETILAGLRPLYELFSRSGGAAEAPASVLEVGGTSVPAVRDGDRSTYDIRAALQAALAASATGAVELAFMSPVAGTITVYPPHVEFHL